MGHLECGTIFGLERKWESRSNEPLVLRLASCYGGGSSPPGPPNGVGTGFLTPY